MLLDFLLELQAANDEGVDDKDVEQEEEPKEFHVVKCTNACTEPNAMMVKTAYTVTAVNAVGRFLRSENIARLTIFQPAQERRAFACTMRSLSLQHQILESIL